MDYWNTRASKVKTTREKAKSRVIGRRKATGPANIFSSGIAGLPERVVRGRVAWKGWLGFLFLADESDAGFVIVFLGGKVRGGF